VLFSATLLLCAALGRPASAQGEPAPKASWFVHATLRVVDESLPEQWSFGELGAASSEPGVPGATRLQVRYFNTTVPRLRLAAGVEHGFASGFVRKLAVRSEAEASTAFFKSTLAADPAPAAFVRQAWLEVTTLAGQFSAGRTTSTWGLGLIAQAGDDDPMQFGVRSGGSVVDRVQYAILPAALWQKGDPLQAFPLGLALAADRVVYDDVAANGRAPGETVDTARNFIAALLYRGKSLQLGAYAVSRRQRDEVGLGLDARSYDLYGAWQTPGWGWQWRLAGEAVLVDGTTTWLRTPANPKEIKLLQGGGVLRVEAERGRVRVRLEGGLASGDDRPFDDTARNFRFATDYRVGMLLFPQLLAAQSFATKELLALGKYSGEPPTGVERLETHGAVTQALYLHPVVRVQAHARLAVLLGAVLARAPVDVAEPFRTGLAGGEPTGIRGAVAKRGLGLEWNAAIESKHPIGKHFAIVGRVDGAWLQPGDAFADPDGAAMPSQLGAIGQLRLHGSW